MKKVLPALLLLLLYTGLKAQVNEKESNNTMATADTLHELVVKKGAVNSSPDNNDFFKTLLPADGTMKIYVTATNTGGNNGYVYLRVYNKRGDQLYSDVVARNTSVAPGHAVNDTITLYSLGADSVYINIYADNQPFGYLLSYSQVDRSTNDAEPNNTVATARSLPVNTTVNGHIGYTANGSYDANDYYKTLPPADGTVKLYLQAKNTGGNNGYFYIRVYNKRGDQLYSDVVARNTSVAPGQTIKDSIALYSIGKDSLFYNIYADNRSFSYQLSYGIKDTSTNDTEPNNSTAQARNLAEKAVVKGHIGYRTNGDFDANDFYKTAITKPGTVKVAVNGINTGGNNGYFYIMVYNKKGDQLYSDVVGRNTSVKPLQQVKDTVVLYSAGADSMYFRVYADNQSFAYQLSYQVQNISENDAEPNDTREQALFIYTNELKKGHIGYTTNGSYDANDYYKTVLPADGTMKLAIAGTNTSGSNGYFYIMAYNKRGDQLYSDVVARNTSVKPNQLVTDTVRLYNLGADTMYLRVYADNVSFSYNISYQLTDSSTNDAEPNNSFAQATNIKEKQVLKGHIGYTANGVYDGNDYYKTLFNAYGTNKIYITAKNNSGDNGYIYFRVYNKKNDQLYSDVVARNTAVKPGQTVTDTITLTGLGRDSLYYNFYADNRGFSYQFSYAVTDTAADDKEPNDITAQATSFAEKQVMKGHIGYRTNGAFDGNDYYKTLYKSAATTRILVSAKNTGNGNGYVYLRVYNKRGDQLLSKVVANNTAVKPGQTVVDTTYLYGLGKDSMYYNIYADNQSFHYQLSYTLIDTATSDKEPNNTRAQAVTITQSKVSGNIGYRTNGDFDANDYFKGAIPNKIGSVKIFVTARNTGSGGGYVYLYAYNKDNNQLYGQVVRNRTDVKPGETIRDTISLSCIESDSLILRMYADNQPFAYQLSYQYTSGPVASFGYVKYGNKFSFIDSSKNLPAGNTYQWQFLSGGTEIGTSTLSKPEFDFPADKFNTVKLTVGNGCLVSTITIPLVEAGKVSYYSPSTGQANTEVLVNFTGGNFDKNAKIFLKKKSNPSISYTATRGGSPSKYQFASYFDLHNVTATGEYFLEVIFSNGAKDTMPFTVLPYTNEQANVQLSLSGPGFMRNGLTSFYNLTVTNTSNKQALGVPVWFAVPNELEAHVMTPTVRLKRISQGIQDTVPLYMKTIGTIGGIREERKVFFMMLGTLGAKETVTIPVRVTQPEHAGKQTRVFAWADQPMYGSPMKDNWKKALKSISKYVSGRYADSTCTDEALGDGGWEAISQAIFNGDSTGTNIISNYYLYTEPLTWKLVDLVFHCYSDVHITRNMMYSLIYNTLFVAHLDKESAPPPGGTKNGKDTIGANNKNTDKWDNNKKNEDINPPVLDSLKNCPKGDCFLTDPFDFDKLKNRPNSRIDSVLNPDNPTLITEILLSIDPNRIDGPSGYTVRKHTKTSANSSYTVHFENKPEATASAQTVVVVDTLDKTKYNFSTFSLSSFTIGDSLYFLPPGAKEYSTTVGIKQFNNVKVWFYAKFDTLTGVLTTRYATVDPTTNDVVPGTDPRGFLPPNTTSPKGEGSITYSIAFKPNLASGTQVNNKASIVFDNNAALITNTWTNIIDITAPTGKVTKAVRLNDSTAMLVLNGSDAYSGVRMYRIYAARNGGAFAEMGVTTEDTVYFSGYRGSSYSFYADVFDSVYNHTTKSAIAEASVTLPVEMLPLTGTSFGKMNSLYWTTVTETNNNGFYVERSNDGSSFTSLGFVESQAANGYSTQRLSYTFNDAHPVAHNWYRIKQVDKDGRYSYSNIVDLNNTVTNITRVYPNPARNNFFISSSKKITAIRLLDVSGRIVKQFTPAANSSYNITGLPAGLYFCEITTEDGREVSKLSIQ